MRVVSRARRVDDARVDGCAREASAAASVERKDARARVQSVRGRRRAIDRSVCVLARVLFVDVVEDVPERVRGDDEAERAEGGAGAGVSSVGRRRRV